MYFITVFETVEPNDIEFESKRVWGYYPEYE